MDVITLNLGPHPEVIGWCQAVSSALGLEVEEIDFGVAPMLRAWNEQELSFLTVTTGINGEFGHWYANVRSTQWRMQLLLCGLARRFQGNLCGRETPDDEIVALDIWRWEDLGLLVEKIVANKKGQAEVGPMLDALKLRPIEPEWQAAPGAIEFL